MNKSEVTLDIVFIPIRQKILIFKIPKEQDSNNYK